MTRPVQVPAGNSESRKRLELKRTVAETATVADRLTAYADRIAITYQDPDARTAATGVLYEAAHELRRLSRELDQVLELHVDSLVAKVATPAGNTRIRPHHYINPDGYCHAGDAVEAGRPPMPVYTGQQVAELLAQPAHRALGGGDDR